MEKHLAHSKNFIVSTIIAFILIISFVSAEEFVLQISEEVTYKDIKIELRSMGTAGSASIAVNNIEVALQLNKEEKVSNLDITLIESHSSMAKISVTQNVECLIDEDCKTDKSCMIGTCSDLNECITEKTGGCTKDGNCVSVGTLAEIDKDLSFCSSAFDWEKRKTFNQECTQNYECLSNLCKEALCTKSNIENEEGENMAPAWILIVFGLILLFKGAFMFYHPEKLKEFLREFSYKRIGSVRIWGAILAIIGILLIVWALT